MLPPGLSRALFPEPALYTPTIPVLYLYVIFFGRRSGRCFWDSWPEIPLRMARSRVNHGEMAFEPNETAFVVPSLTKETHLFLSLQVYVCDALPCCRSFVKALPLRSDSSFIQRKTSI